MLDRYDPRDGADLTVPNALRQGVVVLYVDGAENASVYSWGGTEDDAIAHGMRISRGEADNAGFMRERCRTYSATLALLDALNENADAPWAFDATAGVLDLDLDAMDDREAA